MFMRFHNLGKYTCGFYYLIMSHHVSHDTPKKFYHFLEPFYCQERFRYVYIIKTSIKAILCNVQLKKL